MTQKHVLLTGVTGFVGAALLKYLLDQNYRVSVLSRQPIDMVSADLDVLLIDDLEALCEPNSTAANVVADKLPDVDCVVHCAGLAHNRNKSKSVKPFYRINRNVTIALGRLAADAGVKRFIFISTIGVNGNETRSGLNPDLPEKFTESDMPNPHNDYALSKWEAEQGLNLIASSTNMEVVIIRAPLIYDVDAPGNFRRLIKLVDLALPLPFGKIHNHRSLLALDNLVDFVFLTITHPCAANETFLVADNEALSTTEIISKIALARNKKLLLLPVPVSLIRILANIIGKSIIVESLIGSLVIDITKARRLLNWMPKMDMEQQLHSSIQLRQSSEN